MAREYLPGDGVPMDMINGQNPVDYRRASPIVGVGLSFGFWPQFSGNASDQLRFSKTFVDGRPPWALEPTAQLLYLSALQPCQHRISVLF